VAHNRWWSNETVYARQNGGEYDFVVEHDAQMALPLEEHFWTDLLRESRKWGLTVYEQDWLNDQFNEMKATVSSVTLGRDWLRQMGGGAMKNGLNIQYCMAPSRAALTSLEIPNVVQARVSNDYQPGNDQWQIGISSMFAHALGVAPFKDNFWTTTNQTGNKYNRSELYPELQSLVATLSTGPVAPSDKIGHSNRTLIMRSCNSDGLILKPSRPATAVDSQIYQAAFNGFRGQVWSTYSNISGWIFGIIFATDFETTDRFVVGPQEAGFGDLFPNSYIYNWFAPSTAAPFTQSSPLVLTGCKRMPFCLYMTSPAFNVGSNEIELGGEMDKWVPMSPQRVRQIYITSDEMMITLAGGAHEVVKFAYAVNGQLQSTTCTLSSFGLATLYAIEAKCLPY